MWQTDTQEKVRKWANQHPENLEHLARGRQRIERDKPSGLEQRLRDILTGLNVDFEPSALIKPRFVVDARIGNLIIQADGDYWHGHPRFEPLTERQLQQQKRDRAQDAYLTKCGYTVVRIWEKELTEARVVEVLRQNGVLQTVKSCV
jgi:G:T-mismatch repair DNA endonuclease (very short patch repair protein)